MYTTTSDNEIQGVHVCVCVHACVKTFCLRAHDIVCVCVCVCACVHVCTCVCVCVLFCSRFQTRLSHTGEVHDVTNQEVDHHTDLTTAENKFTDLPAKE